MTPRVLVATDSLHPDPGAVASFASAEEMAAWALAHGYHYVPGSRGLYARDELAERRQQQKEQRHD